MPTKTKKRNLGPPSGGYDLVPNVTMFEETRRAETCKDRLPRRQSPTRAAALAASRARHGKLESLQRRHGRVVTSPEMEYEHTGSSVAHALLGEQGVGAAFERLSLVEAEETSEHVYIDMKMADSPVVVECCPCALPPVMVVTVEDVDMGESPIPSSPVPAATPAPTMPAPAPAPVPVKLGQVQAISTVAGYSTSKKACQPKRK
jgi:hypothetical protein